MFKDAEKIVIYLIPFLLKIKLNVILFSEGSDPIAKEFDYDEENGEEHQGVLSIGLLNMKSHFTLVYSNEDYMKYQTMFEYINSWYFPWTDDGTNKQDNNGKVANWLQLDNDPSSNTNVNGQHNTNKPNNNTQSSTSMRTVMNNMNNNANNANNAKCINGNSNNNFNNNGSVPTINKSLQNDNQKNRIYTNAEHSITPYGITDSHQSISPNINAQYVNTNTNTNNINSNSNIVYHQQHSFQTNNKNPNSMNNIISANNSNNNIQNYNMQNNYVGNNNNNNYNNNNNMAYSSNYNLLPQNYNNSRSNFTNGNQNIQNNLPMNTNVNYPNQQSNSNQRNYVKQSSYNKPQTNPYPQTHVNQPNYPISQSYIIQPNYIHQQHVYPNSNVPNSNIVPPNQHIQQHSQVHTNNHNNDAYYPNTKINSQRDININVNNNIVITKQVAPNNTHANIKNSNFTLLNSTNNNHRNEVTNLENKPLSITENTSTNKENSMASGQTTKANNNNSNTSQNNVNDKEWNKQSIVSEQQKKNFANDLNKKKAIEKVSDQNEEQIRKNCLTPYWNAKKKAISYIAEGNFDKLVDWYEDALKQQTFTFDVKKEPLESVLLKIGINKSYINDYLLKYIVFYQQTLCLHCNSKIILDVTKVIQLPCGCLACSPSCLKNYLWKDIKCNKMTNFIYFCLCRKSYNLKEILDMIHICNWHKYDKCTEYFRLIIKYYWHHNCACCMLANKISPIKYKLVSDSKKYNNSSAYDEVHRLCETCFGRSYNSCFFCKFCEREHIMLGSK